MGEESRVPGASGVEIWRLEHPDLGLIESHIGPAEELAELGPDFPVTTGKDGVPEEAGDIDKPAEVVDAGTVELEQKLKQLGADGIARQILITPNGAPVARLKNLNNTRVGSARQVHHAGRHHGCPAPVGSGGVPPGRCEI